MAASIKTVKLLGLHGRYQNGRVLAERLSGVKLAKTECSKQESAHTEQTSDTDPSTLLNRVIQVDANPDVPTKVVLQLASPAKKAELHVTILTLDSPHIVDAQVRLQSNPSLKMKKRNPALVGPGCQTRAWWYPEGDDKPFQGLDHSIESIDGVLAQHRNDGEPFDGVIGFSQGASLCSLLCSKENQKKYNFQYAVFCSGYLFQDDLQVNPSAQQSLHVYSPLDRMILKERSVSLAEKFKGEKAEHSGGHSVPIPWFHSVLYNFLI